MVTALGMPPEIVALVLVNDATIEGLYFTGRVESNPVR